MPQTSFCSNRILNISIGTYTSLVLGRSRNPLQRRTAFIVWCSLRPSSAFPICIDLVSKEHILFRVPLTRVLCRERTMKPSSQTLCTSGFVANASATKRCDLSSSLQPSVYTSTYRLFMQAQEFMEEFMSALSTVCPHLLIQFEDFASARAFSYLSLFRTRYRVFNDDIQGTGAVVLSGFLNAARLSGAPREAHRIVFYGAGSAGIGVAKMLMGFFPADWSEDARRARIWTVDSQGLIYERRAGKLAEHKTCESLHFCC